MSVNVRLSVGISVCMWHRIGRRTILRINDWNKKTIDLVNMYEIEEKFQIYALYKLLIYNVKFCLYLRRKKWWNIYFLLGAV